MARHMKKEGFSFDVHLCRPRFQPATACPTSQPRFPKQKGALVYRKTTSQVGGAGKAYNVFAELPLCMPGQTRCGDAVHMQHAPSCRLLALPNVIDWSVSKLSCDTVLIEVYFVPTDTRAIYPANIGDLHVIYTACTWIRQVRSACWCVDRWPMQPCGHALPQPVLAAQWCTKYSTVST